MNLVTLVGVPVAILIYLKEQKTQRIEREYGTYDALDNKYIEIQKLCLDYPDLDIFDTRRDNPKVLTNTRKLQEESILLVRIAIFERAYLMYERSSSTIKQEQWAGWNPEISEWLKWENFLRIPKSPN